MNESPIRRVGVVGLGRMGLPMTRHIIRAGFDVSGFDPHAERREALAQAGGQALASVAAVARTADAVVLMVADDAQVLQVALGTDGALATAPPGAVLIVCSTVKPSTCAELAARAGPLGITVLDAPVARGQRAAEDGTLTIYVGGPSDAYQRCLPLFRAFGREVFHLGTDAGAGQVAKLANNLILRAGVVAVYEALTLATRLGVSPRPLLRALASGSADSYAVREFHRINQTWAHKDLAQAREIAAELGLALPLTDRVSELSEGLARDDLRRLLDEPPH